MISFSFVPLRVISAGVWRFTSCRSSWPCFCQKASYGLDPPGFASLVVALLFSEELIITWRNGEYIGRIFEEAKRRPLYVLRRGFRANAPLDAQQRIPAAGRWHGNRRSCH